MLKAGLKKPSSQGRFVELTPNTEDVEVEGFKSYVSKKASHPRYKFLPDRAHDVAFQRLNKGERPENIDITKDMDLAEQRGLHARPNLVLSSLLHRLAMESLVTRAERREIPSKLPYVLLLLESDCDFAANSVSQGFATAADHFKSEQVDVLSGLGKVLTAAEIALIKTTAGPWKEFLRTYLGSELNMSVEKLQRLEYAFGKETLRVTNDYKARDFSNGQRNRAYHRAIKGRELNRLEVIASYDESEALDKEALMAYVAKGLGVDLGDYATTLRRAPTFREGGVRNLHGILLGKNLIKAKDDFNDESQRKFCSELVAKIATP